MRGGVAALVVAATIGTAIAQPTLWQRATEDADHELARRTYERELARGDQNLAWAIAAERADERSHLAKIARTAYEAAIAARPDAAEAHWRLASMVNALYLDCRPERAALCIHGFSPAAAELVIKHWDAAQALTPADPRITETVLANRALLHTRLATPAHWEAARKDYLELLDRMRGPTPTDAVSSHASRNAFVLGNLAETHMMLGDLDRAIVAYREAERLAPDLSRAFGLAVALDRDEQSQAAAEVLRAQGPKAIERFVSEYEAGHVFFVPDGEVSYYLGLANLSRGDLVAAIEHFEAFVRSGAHPRFAPRAQVHIAALRARIRRGVGR